QQTVHAAHRKSRRQHANTPVCDIGQVAVTIPCFRNAQLHSPTRTPSRRSSCITWFVSLPLSSPYKGRGADPYGLINNNTKETKSLPRPHPTPRRPNGIVITHFFFRGCGTYLSD
ncbi:unnamed protein product, partial [Ectocarpus sp. 4 AP-2014]